MAHTHCNLKPNKSNWQSDKFLFVQKSNFLKFSFYHKQSVTSSHELFTEKISKINSVFTKSHKITRLPNFKPISQKEKENLKINNCKMIKSRWKNTPIEHDHWWIQIIPCLRLKSLIKRQTYQDIHANRISQNKKKDETRHK